MKELINAVVNENTKKLGCFMSGSHLPFCPPSAQVQGDISLCLMNVRSEMQEELIPNHRTFLEQERTFSSMFSECSFELPLSSNRGGGAECE